MFYSNGFRLGNVNLFQRTTNAGKFIVNNSTVKMIHYMSVIFGTSGVKISNEKHYKPWLKWRSMKEIQLWHSLYYCLRYIEWYINSKYHNLWCTYQFYWSKFKNKTFKINSGFCEILEYGRLSWTFSHSIGRRFYSTIY